MIIETDKIVYEYPDGTKALENVDFQVEEGKIVALLGPNGAGKSTLFYTLTEYWSQHQGLLR